MKISSRFRTTKNIILSSVAAMALVLFMTSAIFSAVNQRNEGRRLNEALYISLAVESAKDLERSFTQMSQEGRVLALLIEDSIVLDEDRFDTFIRENIADKPMVFGMGYWFEPYKYDELIEYFGPYLYKDDTGNIVKTMAYSNEEYDYLSWDWYNNSIISEKTTVYSAPFYDPHLDTAFITVAVKIMKTFQQIGVVSIDITLREVERYLQTLDNQNETRSFILTDQGYVWGNSEGIVKGYEESIYNSESKVIRELGGLILTDRGSGSTNIDESLYVWTPVGNTGLRLVVEHSKTNIMAEISRSIFLNLLFFALAAVAFILMLNRILKVRIERPLLSIIDDSRQEGSLDMGIGELAHIVNDFDQMVVLIRNLLVERTDYIEDLDEKNQELNDKNEEIEALYNQAAGMNETLQQLLEEVQNGYIVTVRSLSNAIEAKDTYTKGHCENVTRYALAVGEMLGIPGEERTVLEYSALLHDVGKIGIPSSILNKPGKLTEEEFDIIKSHPTIGYDILKDIDFLKRSALVVYQHHERMDGKGYPRGIIGDELDMITKIIAVTDAYDAMTSARAYRLEPLSQEEAMSIIMSGAGTQFDPEVINALKEVLKEEEISLD